MQSTKEDYWKSCQETIHRREYQKRICDLKMPFHYLGFTNRILLQKDQHINTDNYFIPVYVILKIKSIQDIDIHKLSGNISCVIIINVLIQNLPKQLIYLLQTAMNIQLNRSSHIQLKDNPSNNISVTKKGHFLVFTIRQIATGIIVEDTLWSPFEIMRLIVSITFNSIKKTGYQINKLYQQNKKRQIEQNSHKPDKIIEALIQETKEKQIQFDIVRKYNISFNCMRVGSKIPISFAMGCNYSLYDLAQNLLQSYHTPLDSYTQVIRKFQQEKKKQGQSRQDKSDIKGQTEANKEQPTENNYNQPHNWQISLKKLNEHLKQIYEPDAKKKQKGEKVKPEYFQFSHFVIPLYKYPVNSLATMFIPVFLLALLSLSIFFQQNDLQNRIGSIATVVLGYIALIPSIKDQLPPSSRITIIERVIYISTLCCLFSLIQTVHIYYDQSYVFIWKRSFLFLICLCTHAGIFLFVVGLLIIHKKKWEPSYNCEQKVIIDDPQKKRHTWINIYCDQQFYKINKNIQKKNGKLKPEEKNKQIDFIKRYQPKYKQSINKQQQNSKAGSLFGNFISDMTSSTKQTPLNVTQQKCKENTEQKLQKQQEKTQSYSKQQIEVKTSEDKKQQVLVEEGQRQNKVEGQQTLKKIPIGEYKGSIKQEKIIKHFKHEKSLQFLDDQLASGKNIYLIEKDRPARQQNKQKQKVKTL